MIRHAANRSPITPPRHGRQRGVALVVVLILLVVMTLLALVSLRGTLMQERMSANQYDRSLGFQAAEAALREAESVAAGKPPVPGSCTNGICPTPVATDTPRWLDANWDTISQPVSQVPLGALAVAPRYIIEYMGQIPSKSCTTGGDVSGPGCTQLENIYRITTRSTAADRADVTLQTIYAVP